ncbi:putative lipid II flippase FtsW [Candidatus Bipolaricaulota bacterium]
MRGQADRRTILATSLLVLAGLILLYSASAPFSLRHYGSNVSMLLRQAIAAGLGVVALLILARMDYHRLAVINDLLLVGSFLLTAITILPLGVGDGRWLALGPFTFQPTELLKFSLILYLASSLARKGDRVRSFLQGVAPSIIVLAVLGITVLAQPDMGMVLVFGSVTMAMLFFAGARVLHLLGIVGASVPLVIAAVQVAPYRLARVLSFLNPHAYGETSGYQTIQSLIAIGSGGLLGRGLGASRAKLFYLPQSHNDFIASVVAEELGLVGMLVLLGALAFLVWRAFAIAERAPDRLGRLLALGIGFTIGFQALVNISVAVGLLPVTGLTLPFLSNGGSSLIVTLAMVGLLLNVSRQGAQT